MKAIEITAENFASSVREPILIVWMTPNSVEGQKIVKAAGETDTRCGAVDITGSGMQLAATQGFLKSPTVTVHAEGQLLAKADGKMLNFEQVAKAFQEAWQNWRREHK